MEISSALHADKSGELNLIHAGELRYVGHLLGSFNRQGGLLHANADVLDRQFVGHRRLDYDRVVIQRL